jgi:hypothetical protein
MEVIRELGLELQIVFNRDAVMVLPPGGNKGTGLAKALREVGLSPHEVVGVGSSGNDHSFMELCECAVAVEIAQVPVAPDRIPTRGAARRPPLRHEVPLERRRSALVTTDAELRLMAKAANIGESSQPVKG